MPDKQKPVHEVRVGSVKAAIWENPTENGAATTSHSKGATRKMNVPKWADITQIPRCDNKNGGDDRTRTGDLLREGKSGL